MSQTEHALRSHLGAVRRRWPLGLITAATVVAALGPIALGLPNVYRSTVSLLVDQAPDPLSATNTAMLEVNGRLQAMRQEALSRQRALDLAEEFDLYPEQRKEKLFDEIVSMMQRDVKVDPTSSPRGDGRMTIVSFRVSYTGTDPHKVAAVTNRLAQFYVDRNGAIREQQANRATDTLKQELETARARLEAQDRKVIDFTSENAGTLPAQMSSITTKYSQLMQQLQTNTAEVTQAIERRDSIQNNLATVSTASTGADISDPAVRLAQAERELTALLGRLTERSVEVRNKRSEIATLQAQVSGRTVTGETNGATGGATLASTLRDQITSWNTRLAALQARNDEIQAEMRKYDEIIERSPIRNAEFEKLNREAAQARATYEAMQARYQAAQALERAQHGQGQGEFKVLDPAVPAESPSAPNRGLLLGIAALLALGLGLGAMLLVDGFDRSFRSVDELKAFTHVPVLATIPRIVTRKAKRRRLMIGAAAGAAVSVVLAFVSVGAFYFAKQAEIVTRMLLR